ncbi:hypothetical protein ACFX13_045392 [Malus domestica]
MKKTRALPAFPMPAAAASLSLRPPPPAADFESGGILRLSFEKAAEEDILRLRTSTSQPTETSDLTFPSFLPCAPLSLQPHSLFYSTKQMRRILSPTPYPPFVLYDKNDEKIKREILFSFNQ